MNKRLKSLFASYNGADNEEPLVQTSNSILPNFYSSTSHNGKFTNSKLTSASVTDIQTRPRSSTSPSSSSLAPSPLMPSLHSSQSYDVISNRSNDISYTGQTSWVMAAFLLINAALGAGLLNYPVAYDRLGGIGFATMIQFFAVILMATTIMTLVYCAQVHNEDSYHGVMRTMCGKTVMQFAAASIAITCFGICVTFVIIIGDQFDRIFATYIGTNFCSYWFASRYFTMSITAMVTIWPMCYFRRLDFLRHINVLGVIASLYIIFLNVYSYFTLSSKASHPPPIRTSPESALEFTAALPVVFFAYQTHEIVIPVYDSMSDKSIRSFFKSMITALTALFFLYCLAGTFGYMTFGSKVAPDIMLMYDAKDPIVLAGIIALIVKMITTYPPVVFCGRDTLVRLVMSRFVKTQQDYQSLEIDTPNEVTPWERKCNIVITTIWNIVVLALAIIIPNITVAIGFLGSLASCNVFIFPGLALVALTRRYANLRKNYAQMSSNCNDRQHHKGGTFDLNRAWVQNSLSLYGIFIIVMGVVMFVIILVQVYHDFQSQMQHGAVCDLNGGH